MGGNSFFNMSYDTLRNDIASIMNKKDWDDGSLGPVLVRLAWHASGTYDKKTKTGGSNGATMRFKPESTDGANAGLEHARKFLEPIKQKNSWVSYADLWTLAGVVAIEKMGGPKIPWKPGRSDVPAQIAEVQPAKVIPPNGRLPDAAQGAQHIRDIFYRMGFNDQEIVALSGIVP
jgi:catalase (peroxidase I)